MRFRASQNASFRSLFGKARIDSIAVSMELSSPISNSEADFFVKLGQFLTRVALLVPWLVAVPPQWAQGPPYQTDDPVPVDLHHYEFYIFGGMDGTTAEIDSTGPAFEFNWGAIPRVQLHVILPLGVVAPSNNPIYLPGGAGPKAFGLTDTELGAKIAFVTETNRIPQIGTFTMFEMPTGSYAKGLGVGKVWYKIPIWLQKNLGDWTFDGGVGYQVVPQTGYRNFPYTGWLVKRRLSERLELGVEVFAHGREGYAAAQTEASTMIDLGGYYHFKNHPGEQFLFCYGHSIAGQTENYAYIGMYWTWGKDAPKKPTRMDWMQIPTPGRGLE
jgi:Putative MetA-pathway of phenol degradation